MRAQVHMSDDKSFDYWQFFVEEARRVNSPLYARLAEGIGADPEMRALAAQAKKGLKKPKKAV